jgi:uncharacterized membrane protein YkvA (DUF1232 family)
MIAEASNVEAQQGILVNLIHKFLNVHAVPFNHKAAGGMEKMIKDYIEHVPGVLEEVERTARPTDWWSAIEPLLDAVQRYFSDPNDPIPDRMGLVGLLDDAYLAHALLQAVSDRYQAQTGRPLLSADLKAVNGYIRNLIGEPGSSMLDNHIMTLVNGPSMQNVLQRLFAFAGSMHFPLPDTSFGGLSAIRYANLQTELVKSWYPPGR